MELHVAEKWPDSELALIPPKVRSLYRDFELVSQSRYFKIFSAISNTDSHPYTVRALDLSSEFYNSNPNLAATLFVQELLRLSAVHPDAVIIEDFEICDKAIAFVTKSHLPLNVLIKEDKALEKLEIEKLISDVLADLNFLVFNMKLLDSKCHRISLDFDNTYALRDSKGFILGDWAKGLGNGKLLDGYSKLDVKELPDYSEIEKEAQTFGFKILELCGVAKEDLQELMNIKNPKVYIGGLDAILCELEKHPDSLKKTLRSLLVKEGDFKIKLADLDKPQQKKINEEAKQDEVSLSIGQQVLSSSCKLTRTEFRPDAGWGYSKCFNTDGIAFKVSSNIRITGIGLWIPKNEEGTLKGTVKIVVGAKAWGAALISKKMRLRKDMEEANNNIYSLMFETPIDILAGNIYSLVSEFLGGPSTYHGHNGKAKVLVNEEITFEFSKCEGAENGTDIELGQFPEIYFSY